MVPVKNAFLDHPLKKRLCGMPFTLCQTLYLADIDSSVICETIDDHSLMFIELPGGFFANYVADIGYNPSSALLNIISESNSYKRIESAFTFPEFWAWQSHA